MAGQPFDVLIRGAGPVGGALALALRNAGTRVAILAGPAPSPGFRPLALSYASRLILERIGVWRRLAPTPIHAVHVSQQGGFGQTRLEAKDAGVAALGYVIDYAALTSALHEELLEHGIRRAAEDLPARCVVHAEGGAAPAEEKRYGQDALVCLVRSALPAGTTAFERFTPEGPLALLPFEGRYAVIWSTSPARADALAQASPAQFLEALSQAAGSLVGKPAEVHLRAVLPLTLRVRSARIAERAVYIGNAAQTLHPVAGQGLNLGLRDAWDLAQIFCDAPDPGERALLARYATSRRLDALATIRVTDLLAGAFVGSGRVAGAARAVALCALDILPGPRRFFARRMIYGPSALP
jgi:2-octaprenyl-6-methoxyphenol hydroxylase